MKRTVYVSLKGLAVAKANGIISPIILKVHRTFKINGAALAGRVPFKAFETYSWRREFPSLNFAAAFSEGFSEIVVPQAEMRSSHIHFLYLSKENESKETTPYLRIFSTDVENHL